MTVMLPRRNHALHAAGLALVLLLHVGIVYLLLTGAGRKIVRVLLPPVEAFIVAETKPPPPEPPRPMPQPKQLRPAPPASVPPPEVKVAPQPAPHAEAPPAQVTAQMSIGAACPNSQTVRQRIRYPREALREGLTGEVLVEFTVAASGEVRNPAIVKSSNAAFNRASLDAVRQFECHGQGQEVRVQVPFVFKLEYPAAGARLAADCRTSN